MSVDDFLLVVLIGGIGGILMVEAFAGSATDTRRVDKLRLIWMYGWAGLTAVFAALIYWLGL